MPPGTDYSALRLVLDLVQAAVIVTAGIYMLISRNSTLSKKDAEEKIKTVDTKIDTMDGRLQGHSDRISKLEENARCSPSHNDLGNLHGRIDAVSKGLSKIEGQLEGINHTVSMVHKHLLNGSKNGGEA
jgi:chromosome segregation ATPase